MRWDGGLFYLKMFFFGMVIIVILYMVANIPEKDYDVTVIEGEVIRSQPGPRSTWILIINSTEGEVIRIKNVGSMAYKYFVGDWFCEELKGHQWEVL